MRLLISYALLTFYLGVPSYGCRKALTVDRVLQKAKSLNGKTVCVKGLLRPVPDAARDRAFVFEVLPMSNRHRGSSPSWQRLGLILWSKEIGVDGSGFRPNSLKLLDSHEKEVYRDARSAVTFEVVFKGVVLHNRHLLGAPRAAQRPPGVSYDPQYGQFYPAEFVLLEVVSVRVVK